MFGKADMAQPVLVRAYSSTKSPQDVVPRRLNDAVALPPVSSYAFADIMRSVDSNRDFQIAIDGIADICAKTRMSLADEYASHLPPTGEITFAKAASARPQQLRPGLRTALTSVPEASSSSSEGSRKSKRKGGGLFGFRKHQKQACKPMHRMRIGSMGRYMPIDTTTAMTTTVLLPVDDTRSWSESTVVPQQDYEPARRGISSSAILSLQRLLSPTGVEVEA